MTAGFPARAMAEIDALHRLLQAWFRAEGGPDPAPILAHFDEAFTMVTPAGGTLSYARFAAALPTMRGTRPGLVMEITEVELRHHDGPTALVTYHERQTQGPKHTDRASTAFLLDRPDRPTPVWRHLHETMIPPTP